MAPKPKLPIATPEDLAGVTLMHMRTENIKRVRFIDVTIRDPLTLIGGDNDNGKSSFIDSYAWCIGGKSAEIQMDPIRHGAQTGSITCDFGDGEKVKLSVTRTLKRLGDKEWTADVDVDIPGHVAPSRIEEFLRQLTGRHAMDPLAFDRLPPAEKVDALQRLISGFDFKANAAARKKVFDERTDVNRDHARAQSAADSMTVSAEAPCEQVDEAALTEELQAAGEANAKLESRKERREQAVRDVAALRQKATDALGSIDTTVGAIQIRTADQVREMDERIRGLEEQIRATRERMSEVQAEALKEIGREETRLRGESKAHAAAADALQKRLDDAGPLDEKTDTAAITERISAARVSNSRYRDWETQRDRKAMHQEVADRHAAKSADLTAQIELLDAAKTKAIAEAKLPVEGIGFGDGFVTLPAGDGSGPVPWEQAGTAVRTDASIALAMAMEPKLKVILIRNGSEIGRAIRERIRQRAAEKKYRVLMEVVEDNGGTHVVIEDGLVKGARASQEAAA